MSERRDDRSPVEVTLHALMLRFYKLQDNCHRWETRLAPEPQPRVRQAVDVAREDARAVTALADELRRLLSIEAEEYDITVAARLPGDEIRQWPDGSVS